MAKINVRDRNKNTGRRPNWEYRFEIASIAGKRQSATKSGFRTKRKHLRRARKLLLNTMRAANTSLPLPSA